MWANCVLTCVLHARLQGLANMLWSYAKLPVAPPAVVMALVSKITDQLVQHSQRPDGSPTFDAQVSCRVLLSYHPELVRIGICCLHRQVACRCKLPAGLSYTSVCFCIVTQHTFSHTPFICLR
jgi:hypothetical protein